MRFPTSISSTLHVTLTTAFVAGVTAISAAAQTVPSEPLLEPYLAWDRGDYVEALEGYLDVLRGPDGVAHLEAIALLTGELYRVEEVATDGRRPQFGPDGRYALFTVPQAQSAAAQSSVVRVVSLDGGIDTVAELESGMAALSLDGRVAYLRVEETEELAEARAALAEASRSGGGRQAVFAARRALAEATSRSSVLWARDLSTGVEIQVDLGDARPLVFAWASDRDELFVVTVPATTGGPNQVLKLTGSGFALSAVDAGTGSFSSAHPVPGGRYLVLEGGQGPQGFVRVVDLEAGGNWTLAGTNPLISRDGSAVAVRSSSDGGVTLTTYSLSPQTFLGTGVPRGSTIRFEEQIANPALSPDGSRLAYQRQPVHDREIFVRATDGSGEEIQVTREIQHDLLPQWVSNTRLITAKGEGRHRRSFLYDLETGETTKLFHNNTVRTIAPEYEWAPSPDGTQVLIVSERDGDTVSPERALYLLDLTQKVTRDEVIARLEAGLAAEVDLRERGEEMFAPFMAEAKSATEAISTARIQGYAQDLYLFDTKYIGNPGNLQAGEYLFETLESFGYEPEYQWFEPRPGIRTANVLATLPGTEDPELVYVLSSHYDSSQRGPGADDNTSGTTALLEAARVLKDHPQSATIVFAFFTGEEAGLLGSREYVRRAVEGGVKLVGALNNDMVGWANNHRLDNTIRYSNPGIRDVQHNAAILFSDLITYDALYYKSTDAAAYYEEYGDIVGGIGSYPVLGNPNYHQFTDRIETVNHQLVAEVSKTTTATLVLLASSPSRINGLTVDSMSGNEATLSWTPAPESGVTGYRVVYTGTDGVERDIRVTEARVTVSGEGEGGEVRVKALKGDVEGWDWARVMVGR